MSTPLNLIIFDCDSTLSAIEGIDELGRLRGPDVFARVEAMTHDAMNGKISVESVFGERLRIIQPCAADVAAVGRHYIDTVEPTALSTLAALRAAGWTPLILSGGFRNAIRPLADYLGIARVEAVDLFFDAAGNYSGFDENYPTTRSGGKPEVIRALKAELRPARVVMVGDGVSDLETQPEVDRFIGFGRYVAREKVRNQSRAFAFSLAEIPALIA
jgi:phosphoserine phosphatase